MAQLWYYLSCAEDSAVRASGGIGRLAGFRCQCSQGRAGSTPASRTTSEQSSLCSDVFLCLWQKRHLLFLQMSFLFCRALGGSTLPIVLTLGRNEFPRAEVFAFGENACTDTNTPRSEGVVYRGRRGRRLREHSDVGCFSSCDNLTGRILDLKRVLTIHWRARSRVPPQQCGQTSYPVWHRASA